MTKLIKLSVIFLSVFLIFFIFSTALAAEEYSDEGTGEGAINQGLLPTESNRPPDSTSCPAGSNCGGYTLNDMLSVILKISEFILGLVGSLALLAFVAGGLMWLLSAGNAELVARGKQAIIGAVVGLAIVFTSFMIIQLVYTALGIDRAAGGAWAVSEWFK